MECTLQFVHDNDFFNSQAGMGGVGGGGFLLCESGNV